ncbi:MAG: TVP38/TMEM64 family protein [Candidatus Heimdallarchaeota archaeon]
MNAEETQETLSIIDEEQDEDEKKFTWTRDKIILAVIFGLLVIISVGLLIAMLVKEDLLFLLVRDFFIRPIVSINLGPKLLYFIQVLIFLGLMVVQSLLVPIPSELILLSGGIIFGVYWGSVIGLAGSMLSATVTYYISKRGGRALVDASGEKVGIIKRTIYIFDEWIKSWGLWAILVGRAVPVIMFDPISYAAGIAKVKDWHYFLATFIGSIPRAIVYAFLGWKLIGSDNPITILDYSAAQIEATAKQFNVYFFIIFGVLVFMFILSNVIYYIKKWKEKKEAVGEQTDNAIDENDEAELKKIRSELEEIKDEPIEIEATSSEGPQFKEPEPEDIEEIDVVEESEEEEERFGDAFE